LGIIQGHFETYHMSFLGQRAGQNIVYLGSASEPGDYPPGMFTEEEKKSIPGSLANAALNYTALSDSSFSHTPGGQFSPSVHVERAMSKLHSSSAHGSQHRTVFNSPILLNFGDITLSINHGFSGT
jgi:hypothetical protein